MAAFLVMGAWALGFRIGWHLMDRYLDSRRARRERSLRDVTPGRV